MRSQTELMKEKYDWCQRFACFRVISQAYRDDDLEMMKFAVNRYNLLNETVLESYRQPVLRAMNYNEAQRLKVSNDLKKISSGQQRITDEVRASKIKKVRGIKIKLEAEGKKLARRVKLLWLIPKKFPEKFPDTHQGELFDSSEIINACKIWTSWKEFPNDDILKDQFSDEVALIERDYELYKSIEEKEKKLVDESVLQEWELHIRVHEEGLELIESDRQLISNEDADVKEILNETLGEDEKSLRAENTETVIQNIAKNIQYFNPLWSSTPAGPFN